MDYRLVLDSLHEEVVTITKDGKIVAVNRAWREFADRNDLQLAHYGLGVNYLSHCDAATSAGIVSVLTGRSEVFEHEYECHAPDERRWFLLYATPLTEGGHVLGATLSHIDITQRRESEEILKRVAYIDDLTRLPNRRYFRRALTESLRSARQSKDQISIILVDCDNFKSVNDRWGHRVGDLTLREVAKRLSASVSDQDIVARYGGDEFIICLSRVADAAGAGQVCDRIRHAFQKPVNIDGCSLHVTVSLGIAMFPDNGTRVSEVIARADQALYQAKSLGKNRRYSTT